VSALKHRNRKYRQIWIEKHEQDWNFNIAELPLQVFVCCTVSEESKRRQRSFWFIRFSSSKENAWFHVSGVILLYYSRRCQITSLLEGFQQSSYNHNIERLIWCCEDCWLVLKSAFLSRFYIIILHLKYQ